jgi:hypothetical protein
MGLKINDILELLKHTTAEKAVNYIAKQRADDMKYTAISIDWVDYIRTSARIGYDMCSSYVLFPKKLKEAHDRVVVEYKAIKNLLCDQKIQDMCLEINKKFSYSNSEYLIRAPRNAQEINDEGTQLVHCVNTYIPDIAERKTVVMFLRSTGDPDKPFYTVELAKSAVRQCRGFHNAAATDEIQKFLDEWVGKIVNSNLGA